MYLLEDILSQLLAEQVCSVGLQTFAKRAIVVESKKAKPNEVFDQRIYQMLFPQAHWECRS